ncbi:hypothetical protein Q3G72_023020 [Acer saccharum]|nr:hypothetical protein Q3G72_023020 [Acer saccharum]
MQIWLRIGVLSGICSALSALCACNGASSGASVTNAAPSTPVQAAGAQLSKTAVKTDDDTATSITLANGWSCTAYRLSADIYIRTTYKDVDQFQYRIGSAGALVEVRDLVGNNDLLAAPINAANETDRVVQWTLWNMQPKSGAVYAAAGAGQDGRYNMSQAGRDDGLNAATTSAYIVPNSCTVEVFGVQSDNWSAANRAHLTGQIASLTRYTINMQGQLDMQRLLQIGEAYVDGVATPLKNAYLEAWTPFDSTTFRAVALDIDNAANPTWSYATGADVPTYPAIAAPKTKGYAAVLGSAKDPNIGVGLIFGTRMPCWLDNAGHCTQPAGTSALLNMQDFSRNNSTANAAALCLLPALYLGDNLLANTFVDMHLIVAPFHQLSGEVAQSLNSQGAALQAARIMAPGIAIPEDLAADVADLQQNFANSTNIVHTKSIGQLPFIMQQGSNHSLCVDARATPATEGLALVGLFACSSTSAAAWTFFADGTLRLAGRCLEPVANTLTDGGQMELRACRANLSQTWQRVGDTLRARQSALCLDSAAFTKQDARLFVHPCDASAVQQFNFVNPN